MMQLSCSKLPNDNKAERTNRQLIPAGVLIVAATYGIARYAFGLFLPQIKDDLGLSVQAIGIIAGGSYAGYLLATLVGSYISALTGPRFPIVLGGIAATLGMALIGVAESYVTLALGVVLAGASPGLAYPPISDAVMVAVICERRNRVYAWINSGTGVGVIIAAPFVLWVEEDWRLAWLLFALFAAVVTLWNSRVMPQGRFGGHASLLPQLSRGWLWKRHSKSLFVAAVLFGIGTSVYWTFAVDLLVTSGVITAGYESLFWVCIGIAGLLGSAAGDSVMRFGLRNTFLYGVSGCAFAIISLPLVTYFPLIMLSGGIFGATFILVTAVFGIWSMQVFEDRPSAGFGVTFFLISVGQLIGPVLAGALAEGVGLAMVFWLTAGICGGLVVLAPTLKAVNTAGVTKSGYS